MLQSNLAEFRGDEYLCKLGKEYLNALLCKFVVYFLQHSETFDVSYVFLPLTIAELSTLKQVQFFLAHPVHIAMNHCILCSISLQEELLKGLTNKQPKIVAACVVALRDALRYGYLSLAFLVTVIYYS